MARLDIESLMPEENAALWSRGGFTYKFFEGKSCVVVFDAAKQKTYIRELENSVTGLSGDTLALPLNDMEYIITDPDAAYIVIPLFSHCLEIRKSGITRRGGLHVYAPRRK